MASALPAPGAVAPYWAYTPRRHDCKNNELRIIFYVMAGTSLHGFYVPSNFSYYKFNSWEYFDVADVISLHQK